MSLGWIVVVRLSRVRSWGPLACVRLRKNAGAHHWRRIRRRVLSNRATRRITRRAAWQSHRWHFNPACLVGKGGNFAQVISGSDQTGFNVLAGAYLRISDVRYQRVAEAWPYRKRHRVVRVEILPARAANLTRPHPYHLG